MDIPDMNLNELRHQLHEILKARLEEDTIDVTPKTASSIYKDIELEHPDFSYSDACKLIIKENLNIISDPEALKLQSQKILSALEEANIINSIQAKNATEQDSRAVAKKAKKT
jgi:hypothetical protein